GYYAGATGTGSALKSQLTAAMSAGHIQRAYGDFRNSARLHDADPDRPGNILLGYGRESVSGNWDQGNTWNREHVWPVSRQPGSSSNSRRGNLGDPHALRPLKPSTNTSRSNKPFGFENTTGNFGSQGSYYFPGDIDKGDVARSLFYSATRYASSGLTLTDSFPSGNQMGDLTALVAWHYLDTPDEFERRRNHVIYSQALNPSYFTRNRSAFVDVPGAVWSVFVDDLNDSQLWVGSTPNPDGGSCVDASVRALATAPAMSFEVPLNRWGNDGTYYAVISTGDAVSDQPLHNGFTGAFAINEAASRTIRVGIDPSVVAGPGSYSGTVTVDNLDRTTGFGNGFGALDADDVIEVNLEALAASSASFDASTAQLATTIDLGSLGSGQTVQQMVPVYALSSVPGFTAGSDITLNGVAGTGGTLMVTPPA
ncbi:MAG: endonuclease, partial [Planctomycetota bacterium]